jgi:hypothetical protein
MGEGQRVSSPGESRRAAEETRIPLVPERGSGSHGTLYLGDQLTVVKT